MHLLARDFKDKGAANAQIIALNFDMFEPGGIKTARELYDTVTSRMNAVSEAEDKRFYIFLDEVQELPGWEKAANTLLADERCDIYVTGSNSHLLSSDLATLLGGRAVTFNVQPLSFAEYRAFKDCFGRPESAEPSVKQDFERYVREGGFPSISTAVYTDDERERIISDIYSSALLRDVIQHNAVRDVDMLRRTIAYCFDNVGNIFSGKSIADYMKSQQRKIDVETVYNYLRMLENAYIIDRAKRFDIAGHEILKTNEKFYLGDHSLLSILGGNQDRHISGVLENIVYRELKRRGYEAFVGKAGAQEVDFVGRGKKGLIYLQICYRMDDSAQTIEREFAPLLAIKDQYPKYVVSMDDFWKGEVKGVRHRYIGEFLLADDW
jgi:predicted AAA+ superfamily ATPase